MAAPGRLTTYDLPPNNVVEAVDRDMGAAGFVLHRLSHAARRVRNWNMYVGVCRRWQSAEGRPCRHAAKLGLRTTRTPRSPSCSSGVRIPVRTALRGNALFYFGKGSVGSDEWGRLIGCSARRIPLTGQCRSADRTLHASRSSQCVRGPPDRKASQNALPPYHERRRRCDVNANSHAPLILTTDLCRRQLHHAGGAFSSLVLSRVARGTNR
ncbi:hypothetical protein C8Q78DRAFT_275836 [Trametes maxima]|nr:hypothetical protein C8Q78DRAFT_275836 [Trametes maxima]